MYKGKSILALITARGGSKGIPGKNIADLGGKPLIAWTIEAGLQSTLVDRLILSTDDTGIAEVARQYGCEVPFMRPAELAGDEASSVDVTLHALGQLEEDYDYLLLLQPTSPFRNSRHIDQAVMFGIDKNALLTVSVSKSKKSPELFFYMDEEGALDAVIKRRIISRRQDAKPTYYYNGAFYLVDITYFRKVKSFKTEEAVGVELEAFVDVDIDEPSDLEYARYIAAVQEKEITG